jgi:hypothetical protein
VSPHDELERDPLPEELKQLYRRLQPPALPDEAAEADTETARVVQWMRDAWSGLEAPARATCAKQLALRPVRRSRLAFAAAAAALLLAGAAALWRERAGDAPLAPAPRVAQGDVSAAEDGVELISVRPDHVELRSGPVRLVLLGPPPSDSTPDTGVSSEGM